MPIQGIKSPQIRTKHELTIKCNLNKNDYIIIIFPFGIKKYTKNIVQDLFFFSFANNKITTNFPFKLFLTFVF